MLVVINKIDQNPNFDLDRNILRRKYPNILDFYRLSCKTDAGLPELQDAIKSAIPQTELIKTPVAASWMKVKATLENVTRDKCYISHNEFHNICDSAAIPTDTTRETLVQFLNELGIVLHFKDFELQEYHVLNPRWVTEGVYRIINSKILADEHGLLKTADLDRIINKEKTKTCPYSQQLENRPYTPGEQNYIVRLMQKFELCYALDEETILVPSLLDTKEPPLQPPGEPGQTLDFILTYDFLPKSVISRLLVKLHKDLAPGQSWRTGMVLESDLFHTHALIRADEVERTIAIHIRGAQKREHLSVIRSALREINKSFQQMKIEELIPLPLPADILHDYREKNKVTGKYARTVSYSFLLGYERIGLSEYFDGETGQRYSVAQLLDSVTLPEERKGEGFDIDGTKDRFHRSMDDFGKPEAEGSVAKIPLVSQNEDSTRFEKIKELVLRIENLWKKFREAKKRKDGLDDRATKVVRMRFAILWGINILFIAVLSLLLLYKVLTWGGIESYTYIGGLVLFACNMFYLLIKGNSINLSSIYNKHIERERENFYQLDNFDAAEFLKLEKELKKDLEQVNKELFISDSKINEDQTNLEQLVERILPLAFKQMITDGVLALFRLSHVGPLKKLQIEPGRRLNIIAGDNGVGKTFLLECIWWALVGSWSGKPVFPRAGVDKHYNISIQSQLISTSGVTGEINTYKYNWIKQEWSDHIMEIRESGLVIYARFDDSFAVWDPIVAAIEKPPGVTFSSSPLVLTKMEIFNGLDAPDKSGKKICNGLISDWMYWQTNIKNSSFLVFKKILGLLSSRSQEKLKPGEPTTIPGDTRKIPTISYPYGEVPIIHTASSVQRILAFAYMMIWVWETHKKNCKDTRRATCRSMIVLFDELECHLHPQWQRTIISSLLKVKKYLDGDLAVQFFITTHSPLLMASLEPHFDKIKDRILLMDIEGEDVTIKEQPLLRLGPVGNWLTSDIFGLRQARSLEAEVAIVQAMQLQEKENPTKDEVEKVHQMLIKYLGDVDPFWPRWLFFAEQKGVKI